MHYAAYARNWKLVRWLVRQGLDINEKTKYGDTVLYFATESGNEELLEWLKERGAKE